MPAAAEVNQVQHPNYVTRLRRTLLTTQPRETRPTSVGHLLPRLLAASPQLPKVPSPVRTSLRRRDTATSFPGRVPDRCIMFVPVTLRPAPLDALTCWVTGLWAGEGRIPRQFEGAASNNPDS